MPQGARDDASLRHQLVILRRRWFVVVLLAVLGCATAAVLTSRKAPVYQATASVVLRLSGTEPGAGGVAPGNPTTTATEREVLRSQAVRSDVAAQLGREPDVAVEVRPGTGVLDIQARSTRPTDAAEEATTYAEVYVERRQAQRAEELQRAGQPIRAQITELDQQLDELASTIRQLDAAIAAADARSRPARIVERDKEQASIGAQRRDIEDQRGALADQLDELELRLGVGASGDAELVSEAVPPTDPVSPSPLRNGALGLTGGLVLGLALASLLDHVDDRLRGAEDLEAAVDLPVVGLLPWVSRRRLADGVGGALTPGSPSDEAYRTLRTNLQLLAVDQPVRCLQVTSPTANEGKTTVVTNLAASFARAGQRVILLDADLREPKVHEAFGLPNETGFSSVLLGQRSLAEAITTLEGESFLVVLTAGPVPTDPTELLASHRAKGVLATLRANCDILLIDAPPVLPVTDALVVSRHVDATVLVTRSMRSTRRQVGRARQLLERVGAPVVGTVLNGVVQGAGGGRHTPPPKRTPRKKHKPPQAAGQEHAAPTGETRAEVRS